MTKNARTGMIKEMKKKQYSETKKRGETLEFREGRKKRVRRARRRKG